MFSNKQHHSDGSITITDSGISNLDVVCAPEFNRTKTQRRHKKKTSLEKASSEVLKKQRIYNSALALHPDFPYQHLCSARDNEETEKIKRKLLQKLEISEAEYRQKRTKIQKASIHSAAYFGHLDAIKSQLIHINDIDEFFNTPLQYALLGRQMDGFRLLLDNGADTGNPVPEASDKKLKARRHDETLLDWMFRNRTKIPDGSIDILLQYNPKISSSSLVKAIDNGNLSLVKLFLGKGISARERYPLYYIQPTKPHAVEIARLLVENGASVSETEENVDYATFDFVTGRVKIGNSLAAKAAIAGNNELLKFFLEHDAKADGIPDMRPLHSAIRRTFLNFDLPPSMQDPLSLQT